VTRPPEFEDVVGSDLPESDEERLRRVHDLLVIAGPPPELPPHLEAGPTLAMTLSRPHRRGRRRVMLLAAALIALALVFLGGYVAGNSGSGLSGGTVLKLTGTPAAPNALASLRIEPVDPNGNWPMDLSATGLPKLPPQAYYEVFLVREGKLFAPCGSFVVKGSAGEVSVSLNAPYHLQRSDSWVVTRQVAGRRGAPTVVLRPTT
jgi:hypothetical protein